MRKSVAGSNPTRVKVREMVMMVAIVTMMGLRAVTCVPGWREDEEETAKRISSPAASPYFPVPPKPQPATFL